MSEQMPQEVAVLVGPTMVSVAWAFWWQTESKDFDNRKPCDVYKEDPQRVVDYLKAPISGDVA